MLARPFLGFVLLASFAVPSALTQATRPRVGSPPRARVVTVLGEISPDLVGVALVHEHLAINMLAPDSARGYLPSTPPTVELVRRLQESGRYFRVPRTAEQLAFWNQPDIAPEMLDRLATGWLTRSNFVIDGSAPLEELAAFRRGGGRTVVDATTVGIGRDPIRLRDLARQSGVNVVMGTGWYRWMFHPAEVARSTVDQLADVMIREITTGVGTTGVRAGIIGEIPVDAAGLRLDPPIDSVHSDSAIVARRAAVQARIRSGRETPSTIYDPAELKVLRAAARASRRTGAAITLHAPDPWIDYLDVLADEGADLRRVVIGHADYVMLDSVLAARAFARGVFVQLDYTLQRFASRDQGPFEQLLDRIAWAVRAGHGAQLLVSLDLCFRQGLFRYGGGGYATLAERIVPGLRRRGVSEAAIRQILVDNPRRVLTLDR